VSIQQPLLFSAVTSTNYLSVSDATVYERTELVIVHHPTRGEHTLDRIYVSLSVSYLIRVVTLVVKSDHKAVVAYNTAGNQCTQVKTSTERVCRQKSPPQHAVFPQHAATVNFHENLSEESLQSQFDLFYTIAHNLLDSFYPERFVTITSRDPPYITGYIKSMLHRKNRLMRKGRVEEASALAKRIGKEIRPNRR